MQKIVHLQALRAIAASLVVANHSIGYMVRRGRLPEDLEQFSWFVGWIGVATFFVISGLIMIRTASDGFGVPGRAGDFACRRIVRVVPLYWLALIPAVIIYALRAETPIVDLLKSMFFIPYLDPVGGGMRPVLGQGWTLNYEMMFYAIFAACLLLPRKAGLAILLAVFPAIVVAGAFLRPMVPFRDAATVLEFWTDPIILLFTIGILIGLAEQHVARWHRFSAPIAATLAIFAVLLAVFRWAGVSFPLQLEWQIIFGLACTAAVILCTSARETKATPIGRLLEAAGDASYSTYLFHGFMLVVFAAVWARLPAVLQEPMTFILVTVILANIGGYVSYRFLELPLTRRLKRFCRSGAQRPAHAGDRA